MTHRFLSEEWFRGVRNLIGLHGPGSGPGREVMANLVVTGTPFGSDKEMHVGSHDGSTDWGEGHVEEPDFTLTLDYETAKEVVVTGDPQSGMQAFMAGRIKVQGDMTKLMLMMRQPGGAAGSPEFHQAVEEITE